MKEERILYRPIQPSIKQNSSIVYKEILPALHLRKYVYCYWQLESSVKLVSNYHYKVVADGCTDIFFNNKKSEESFVMGFCKKYEEFSLGVEFKYSGIRFLPSYFSQFFSVDAMKLSNCTTELDKVHRDTSDFINAHFTENNSLGEIASLLDGYLGQCCLTGNFSEDDRFYDALQFIYERKGILETESDLNTGLSPRQLRRVFNRYIGTSPKAFSKVVQFQAVIRKLEEAQESADPSIYLDAGFYDQAHFIKDFLRFYGVTPSQVYS